jgi:O-acetyl-ADP-ribose deacetylase (regulator of RNase III)
MNDIGNYAHGCNCAGAMGRGIAVQFRKKFPKMYQEYKQLCSEGSFGLGDIFPYHYDGGCVFNLGTQLHWRDKAEIWAIEESLRKMISYSLANGIVDIALPRIGAGLGGLDWVEVKPVFQRVAGADLGVNLFVVENYSG